MNPLEPAPPARRNMPMVAVMLLVVLVARGIVFVWPW